MAGGTIEDKPIRRILDSPPMPAFLEVGLNAKNVKEALDTVQPFGLDVCSGVGKNGALDSQKLERFMKAVFS